MCVCVTERSSCIQDPKLRTNLLKKDGDKNVGHQLLVSDYSAASKTFQHSATIHWIQFYLQHSSHPD